MNQDNKLVREILLGSEHSFRFLIEKYKKLIFSISYNVVKDFQESENITQEVFTQLYISLRDGKDIQNIKAWLSKVALNKSINLKNKLSRVECIDDIEKFVDEFNDTKFQETTKYLVDRNINMLPDKYKDILKMYYVENKTYREIALIENISERTVETRLYRAKKILREKWSDVHYD